MPLTQYLSVSPPIRHTATLYGVHRCDFSLLYRFASGLSNSLKRATILPLMAAFKSSMSLLPLSLSTTAMAPPHSKATLRSGTSQTRASFCWEIVLNFTPGYSAHRVGTPTRSSGILETTTTFPEVQPSPCGSTSLEKEGEAVCI